MWRWYGYWYCKLRVEISLELSASCSAPTFHRIISFALHPRSVLCFLCSQIKLFRTNMRALRGALTKIGVKSPLIKHPSSRRVSAMVNGLVGGTWLRLVRFRVIHDLCAMRHDQVSTFKCWSANLKESRDFQNLLS